MFKQRKNLPRKVIRAFPQEREKESLEQKTIYGNLRGLIHKCQVPDSLLRVRAVSINDTV